MNKVDYSKNHYCTTCEKPYPLDVWKCPKCKRPLKSTPASAIRNHKYQDQKPRY